jgi:hypothetical protein
MIIMKCFNLALNKKPHLSVEKWGDLFSSILLPPYGCGGEIGRRLTLLFCIWDEDNYTPSWKK